MIRGVHHISLHAKNLDKMVQFYGDAFGFKPATNEMVLRKSEPFDRVTGISGGDARMVMLDAGNCFIELFEWNAPEGRSGAPLAPNDHGYTHLCIDVTDIESEYPRLSALGMTFTQPAPVSAGRYKTVYGRDPEGNVIEIQQVPDRDVFDLKGLQHYASKDR
jgi:glyoxylase I family protein